MEWRSVAFVECTLADCGAGERRVEVRNMDLYRCVSKTRNTMECAAWAECPQWSGKSTAVVCTTLSVPRRLSTSVQCRFTSTETVRTVRDGEPRTATLTFTQLLSSVLPLSFSCCLTSLETVGTVRDVQDVHLIDFHTALEL